MLRYLTTVPSDVQGHDSHFFYFLFSGALYNLKNPVRLLFVFMYLLY